MLNLLINIVCLVTIFTSLHLGTRIAWSCGSQCKFSVSSKSKRQSLIKSIPAAIMVYSFGFVIAFSYYVNGIFPKIVFSLTSATILSTLIVSMAMPELKRKPPTKELVLVELVDGSTRQVAKKELNVFLSNDKVTKFKRSEGWVLVGIDRLRVMNNENRYSGVERREAA